MTYRCIALDQFACAGFLAVTVAGLFLLAPSFVGGDYARAPANCILANVWRSFWRRSMNRIVSGRPAIAPPSVLLNGSGKHRLTEDIMESRYALAVACGTPGVTKVIRGSPKSSPFDLRENRTVTDIPANQ